MDTLSRHGSDIFPQSLAIPVLCYHSWTIGKDYQSDDHLALESDLHTLEERGYKILPLAVLVDLIRGRISPSEFKAQKLVCISCDDGKRYDYFDCRREDGSVIKSFRRLLFESKSSLPNAYRGARATAFVICSEEARRELSVAFNESYERWTDSWWLSSAREGILGIANHSWDHLHDALEAVRQEKNKKGSFFEIQTLSDADAQIADAQATLKALTAGQNEAIFGYPYGHVSTYLRDEYFPEFGAGMGLTGAFSTGGDFASLSSNVWDIPRFVCGFHWKSAADFNHLLDAAESHCDNSDQVTK